MKREELEEHVRRVHGTGYGDWQNENAVRLYFNPLCSALFTDDEWHDFMLNDDVMRPNKPDWFVRETAKRLEALVRALGLPKGTTDTYITFSVYGAIGCDDFTVTVHAEGENPTAISRCVPWFPNEN